MNLYKRRKTGGRTKYLGYCVDCKIEKTQRWYRLKENKSMARCQHCYGKLRLCNKQVREIRNKQRKEWGEKYAYRVFLNLVKYKKYTTDITNEEYLTYIKQPCHYCGGSLPNSGIRLDRVDNTIGYLNSNVVPCCKTCNIAKNNKSVEEFKVWVINVYNKFQIVK